jgi:hypothetical protein
MTKITAFSIAILASLGLWTGSVSAESRPFPSPVPCYIFTMPLRIGSVDMAVKQLQIFLNQNADTQVAFGGPGSPGFETMYFGPATQKAIIKFQEKHSADVLLPAGLARGTGFVGVLTRQKINALMQCNISTSLNVSSPAGSEVWRKGETKTISWGEVYRANNSVAAGAPSVPTGLAQVTISLVSESTSIAFPIVQNHSIAYTDRTFSYSWQVGNLLTMSSSALQDGQYRIQVCVANTSMCGTSAKFTISSSQTTNVTINSLSPNSGRIGTSVFVSGTGFTGNETVYFGTGKIAPQYVRSIYAQGSNGVWGYGLTFTVPNDLVYDCSCPPNMPCVCPTSNPQINPGIYNVTVSNSGGTSNIVPFTVTQ